MAKVIYYPSAKQLWTPAQSPPDFWFNPVDSSLSLNGNEIIMLNDYLGNGKSVSAPTNTQRPLRVQNGLGSNNIVRFDGVNDILQNTVAGAANLTTAYVLAVMKFNAGGSSEDLPIVIGSGYATGKMRAFYRASNGTALGFAGWAADVSSSTHTLDIGVDFNMLGFTVLQLATPGNVQLEKNGTVTTHGTSSGLSATIDGLSFGSVITPAASYCSAIDIAEILVYYGLPSTTVRDNLRGYLAWQHGQQAKLPANFIYKDAAPTL